MKKLCLGTILPEPLPSQFLGHHPRAQDREAVGQCCLWLAESPSHLRGSRMLWGCFDGEKHLKSLLSTQAHSEALTAGQGEAVAAGQMGGDQRAFCARTRTRPDLVRGRNNFPPECCKVKLHKVPSHRKRQDSSHIE